MAFVIASPLLDGIVLGVLLFLVGPALTALYAILAFVASMLIAAVLSRAGLAVDLIPQAAPPGPGRAQPTTEWRGQPAGDAEPRSVPMVRLAAARMREAAVTAWRAFLPLAPHLLLGSAIGALLRGLLPIEWITAVAGPEQAWGIPVLAAVGLPLYINAEILLPITAALLDKGIGPGPVMALVISGLGLSVAELIMLRAFFRTRVIAALVASIFGIAVLGGSLASVLT